MIDWMELVIYQQGEMYHATEALSWETFDTDNLVSLRQWIHQIAEDMITNAENQRMREEDSA